MPYVCINSIQTLYISNRNVVSHHELKCTGRQSVRHLIKYCIWGLPKVEYIVDLIGKPKLLSTRQGFTL